MKQIKQTGQAEQSAPTFEAGMARLEEILAALQREETPLADAVKLYAEAAEQVAFCDAALREAKLQIEEIDAKLAPDSAKEEGAG